MSTYVGHAIVSNTYWYLSAVPELMALAAKRFESFTASLGGGTCVELLHRKGVSPRMMAGAPVTDDVLKCQLEPIADADYLPVVSDAAAKARLAAIFPSGVCDYGQAGVSQRPVDGTWQRY